jgi:hypothetical protein
MKLINSFGGQNRSIELWKDEDKNRFHWGISGPYPAHGQVRSTGVKEILCCNVNAVTPCPGYATEEEAVAAGRDYERKMAAEPPNGVSV